MNQIIDYPDLWRDALVGTLVLFFGGGLIALVLGLIVAAMRVSPVPVARAVGTVYVNWIRNTPLTLIVVFCSLGLVAQQPHHVGTVDAVNADPAPPRQVTHDLVAANG